MASKKIRRRQSISPRSRAQSRSRPARRDAKAKARPTTIDDYLAGVSDEKRIALAALRRAILKIVPDAEECISYAIPAFRRRGAVVAGFAATARGCSYFPFSGSTLQTLADAIEGYSRTKSALHFAPDRPLPASLLRKLIRTRIAETRG